MFTQKCPQCCENVLRVTMVSTDGTTFTTNSTITPKNGCKYIIKVPCSLIPTASSTTISQVVVVVNGTKIPLQECVGNDVYTDQIRYFNVDSCGNIVLRVVYGSTPAHFKIISQRLCDSNAYGMTAATANTLSAKSTTTKAVVKE